MKSKKDRDKEKFQERLDNDEVLAFTWNDKHLPANLWCTFGQRVWDDTGKAFTIQHVASCWSSDSLVLTSIYSN